MPVLETKILNMHEMWTHGGQGALVLNKVSDCLQAMFDISYFRKNPRPFFKFAKVFYCYIKIATSSN